MAAYDHVFWVCGNHELWIRRGDRAKYADGSLGKLAHLKSIADELGVKYKPERVGDVWVVPIWSWYHASWDTEPDVAGALPIEKVMMDFHACHWPTVDEGEDGDGDEDGGDRLARVFDAMNDETREYVEAMERIKEDRLGGRGVYVVSFSHFLPSQDLLPEKRFLYFPNLAKAVGSDYLGRRVFEEVRPDCHVYGHTHFTQDTVKDGIRFVQWPLGYPKEQRRRRHGGEDGKNGKNGWGPLLLWDKKNGVSAARSTYWSEFYRANERRPHDVSPAPYVVRRRSGEVKVNGAGGNGVANLTARMGGVGLGG